MRWAGKVSVATVLFFTMLLPVQSFAAPKVQDAMSNPLAQVLVAIAFLLLLCIALLGYVLNGAAEVYRQKLKNQSSGGQVMPSVIAVVLLLLLGGNAVAQEAATPPAVAETISGLSYTAFYLLVGVIVFEILVIMAMVIQLRYLAGIGSAAKEKVMAVETAVVKKPKANWWWRINNAVSLEREKEIDLSHDYDGISELDNKVPPWWLLAFGMSVLFGVVYLYRYHVVHSAPLQIEELELALKKGEEQRTAYLAQSAGNVDETSVTLMDGAAIAAGKSIYDANCVACHGSAGEGNAVGPNLTDKYWLHGGDIKDIFKTVKYGWPEKGMQSWKETLSPVKIAQVSNYVLSLVGTNPANAKEPQGELFEAKADAPAIDSAAAGK